MDIVWVISNQRLYWACFLNMFCLWSRPVGPVHLDRWCSTSTCSFAFYSSCRQVGPFFAFMLYVPVTSRFVMLYKYLCLVISNLWTIFWYTTCVCSFSLYVVGSSGETYLWCCNKEWVISTFLHFLCIYWQHTVCLFISVLFFTLLYNSKLYSQRTIWSIATQSKEVFMFKRGVFLCSHL